MNSATRRAWQWGLIAAVALGLAVTLAAPPAHGGAAQPYSQSPLATPFQRRSQQVAPFPTPAITLTPYQVSPLRIDDAERPLFGDAAALWVGAAGLLLLGGSGVLVLTRRR